MLQEKRELRVAPPAVLGVKCREVRQVFFQGHSCIEMEGQEFLTEYRSISNKLKKRFLRFVTNS